MMLKINEMFVSIQGESSWAGFPFFFIRTSGCNLRCKYCDTKYAYYEGKNLKIESIIEKVRKSNIKNVLITGGEPLIQKNIYKLINELIEENFNVLIETNGSILLKDVNTKAIKIMDIKTPSSGESRNNKFENVKFLNKRDEVKFVISNYDDFVWSIKVIEKYDLKNIVKCINFSPVYDLLPPKTLANWLLEKNLDFIRLNLQIHKLIGMR